MSIDILSLAIGKAAGGGGGGSQYQPKIQVGTITLSTTWSGSDPYSQTVTVTGATVTENSKIDIQLSESQLFELASDGVAALMIENDNGVLTAWAQSATNTSSITIQCTVTELG